MTQAQVDRPRRDELPALLALFDGAFKHDDPDHPSFVDLMPHLYRPQNFRAQDHLVVRDGGRPVSGLLL